MDNNFLPRGAEVVKQAIAADEAKNYKEAVKLYRSAGELFMLALKYETSKEVQNQIKSRLLGYISRAEELQKALDDGGGEDSPHSGGASAGGTAAKKKGDSTPSKKDEEAKLSEGLAGSILAEKPNVKWDDVAGLEQAKESLKEAVILPTRFPQLFTGKRKPWKGILLYGPPGTGKSYLAKALATESDSCFLSLSSSDLVSKWQGESERLVKAAFQLARDRKPSIVFIDEIDSLCTSRSEGESEASRRIKTEFLVQMDGVGSDQAGVLILGATNVPWEIDNAMRRRFEKRVYIALPEAPARSHMFKVHLGQTDNSLTVDDFINLGVMADGYSGSDISVVVREALMEPIRKCQVAKQFYENPQTGMLTPCENYPACPDCPIKLSDTTPLPQFAKCGLCNAVRMSLYDVPGDKLEVPFITFEDFLQALKKAHSSVGSSELSEYTKWTSEFGQDG
jgi:vacuolar protein-sorting-associated protein 4